MFPFLVDAAYLSWHSSWWHMKENALKWEWNQFSQNSCFSSSSSQFLLIANQWVVGTLGEHWQKQIELRAQVDTENELPPIFTIFVNLIAQAWFKCKQNAKSFEQDEFKGVQHNQQCFVFSMFWFGQWSYGLYLCASQILIHRRICLPKKKNNKRCCEVHINKNDTPL